MGCFGSQGPVKNRSPSWTRIELSAWRPDPNFGVGARSALTRSAPTECTPFTPCARAPRLASRETRRGHADAPE